MFSYFGSKSKLVHLYPPPLYDKLIEPFAGSARYACRYFNRDVWINDLNPTIYGIWKWIQQASKQDVRSLPVLKKGEDLRNYKQLSQPERDLLGFAVQRGSASSHNVVSSFSAGRSKDGSEISILKSRVLKIVTKIGHWKITNSTYAEIPNTPACWFLDPPYAEMGHRYMTNNVDYNHLAAYCQSRQGQVIVCEGGAADWLPFKMIRRQVKTKKAKTANRKGEYVELIWYRSDRKRGFGFA